MPVARDIEPPHWKDTFFFLRKQNYDKYLAGIGVTPLMAQMVLRSDFMITIYEDIDKCWKVLTETSIKAKSIKGYKCRNYKMTSNKFMLEEEKPELLDDWDPRLVVTTLTFDEETKSLLVFDQVCRVCQDNADFLSFLQKKMFQLSPD